MTLSPFVQSPVTGFTHIRRANQIHYLRNEAESDSLALRLTDSLPQAPLRRVTPLNAEFTA